MKTKTFTFHIGVLAAEEIVGVVLRRILTEFRALNSSSFRHFKPKTSQDRISVQLVVTQLTKSDGWAEKNREKNLFDQPKNWGYGDFKM